jgi:hypothetical protein
MGSTLRSVRSTSHPTSICKLTFPSLYANPNLNFIAIINPSSGPGEDGWWPNADYVREIQRLKSYSNLQIVGYVRSTYCKRPIDEVFKDIKKYADRSKQNKKLQIQGVFVDETTNLYTPDVKQYLDSVDNMVWTNQGIGGKRLVSRISPRCRRFVLMFFR